MASIDWLTALMWALALYGAFKAGQWTILWPIRKLLEAMAKKEGLTLEELVARIEQDVELVKESAEQAQDQVAISVERHHGHYYAYAKSGEFVGQGPDFRTMWAEVTGRFPKGQVRLDQYQPNLSTQEVETLVKEILGGKLNG